MSNKFPEDEDVGVSVKLAAEYLGGSGRTIRRLLEMKELEGYKLGDKEWRTCMRALREYQKRGGSRRGWRHR